ncbi:MAG: N-acetylglucosamine-6-phosphate deacetylase [bacterium]
MGEAQLVRGGAVLGTAGWCAPSDIRIVDGRIAALGADLPNDGAVPVDAGGLRVVPGFVDLHVHGAGGAMFEDGDAQAVRRIVQTLPRLGTTALLATISALPPSALQRAVEIAAAAMRSNEGARILGIHLEGPFLNPARAGAQHVDWMRPPALDEFDALQRRAGGAIRLVTLAPELPGALELISALRRRDVHVSLGHSEADAAQVEAAIAAGASHVTHLFNAMAGLHHRAPGLPGIGLTDDRVCVELIADGAHIDPRVVDLVWRCKPAGRVLLVSDGVAAIGGTPGPLTLFGAACIAGDAVRRADNGHLAGSCTGLATAVRNIAGWCPRLPLADVLSAASTWPAHSLRLDAGQLAIEQVADLVLLDAHLGVRAVASRGDWVDLPAGGEGTSHATRNI